MTVMVGAELTNTELLELFGRMVLIRRFEERTLELRAAGRVHGVVHPYIGQEAVAVGVCSALRLDDRIVSTHRGHGHCIAKGANIDRMMAELFGRRDGYCRGKGGSMHIAAFEVGMLGANGIVAGGLPIAAGAALAARMTGSDGVSVGFFGDGATGEGAFHEALNVSTLWKLPVVWVCENNMYASSTPLSDSIPSPDVAQYGSGYGLPSVVVDGNDVLAVRQAAVEAVARARSGEGPTLIEAKTYRWTTHFVRDQPPRDGRPQAERDEWMRRDPIVLFGEELHGLDVLTPDLEEEIRGSVALRLEAAVEFAEASPYPEPAEAFEDVFAP